MLRKAWFAVSDVAANRALAGRGSRAIPCAAWLQLLGTGVAGSNRRSRAISSDAANGLRT